MSYTGLYPKLIAKTQVFYLELFKVYGLHHNNRNLLYWCLN